MKKNKQLLVLMGIVLGMFLALWVLASCAKPTVAVTERPVDLQKWKLVWSDEFDSPTVDTTKWHVNDNPVVIGNMLNYNAPDDVYIENGNLVLRAQKRNYQDYKYTAGNVDTAGTYEYSYGKVEVRARLPKGKGMWPAIWSVGEGSEIDFMEMLGDRPTDIFMTYHGTGSGGGFYSGPDYSADFHTFGIEWQEGEVRWFIDGIERGLAHTNVADGPQQLIINSQVGGDWAGYPDETTIFPNYMLIDYVRVYQPCDGCTMQPTATLPHPTATFLPPTPIPIGATVRIDSASFESYTDTAGNIWNADNGFIDGNTVDRGRISIDTSAAAPRIYQTERWGLTGYDIPAENGAYTVKLHFAETYWRLSGPRQRVFTVDVQGQELKNFDIWAEAGGLFKAVVKTFDHVMVTDGMIRIRWTRMMEAAIVNGIEILPGIAATPTVGPTPTPTQTPPPSANLALNKPALASSGTNEASGYGPSAATDGGYTTRWTSAFIDPQWWYVDLGQVYDIDRVAIYWEAAYGKKYDIQVSDDAQNWTTIKNVSNGDGGLDDISGLNARGRYVQISCSTRGTQWGDSFWEFEIYAPVTVSQVTPTPVGPSGFVMGVNMNGGPVTIDGEQWLGYDQAQTTGVITMRTPNLQSSQTDIAWEPAATGDLKTMLDTQIWNWMIGDVNIMVPLTNGDYQLYLWVAEDLYTDRSRLFKLSLQGTDVLTSEMGDWLGLQPLHNWTKYGPFNATVDHEQLLVGLIHLPGGHEPTLSGFAIYKK